jgi:hypothetical protein
VAVSSAIALIIPTVDRLSRNKTDILVVVRDL